MGLGADFIASVLASGDLKAFLKLGTVEDVFLPTEVETYTALIQHATKYGAIPSEDALTTACGGDPDLPEYYPDDPPEYFYDLLKERYLTRSLSASMAEARKIMQEATLTSGSDAYEKLMELLTGTARIKQSNMLYDMKSVHDSYMAAYKEKFHVIAGNAAPGVQFGWPTMDYGNVGLHGGDVVSYVGRPGLGKTWMLLSTAHHAWYNQGKSVAFVTLEMAPSLIMDRLMSINTKVGISDLMMAKLATTQLNKVATQLSDVFPNMENSFVIVDGIKAATVDDLARVCQYQGVDALFIDGAYMLKLDDPRLSKYAKVGENVESIKKQIAEEMGIPVICSYQFNREAPKKQKKKEGALQVGLEDIGYSDAIGQFSSIVIGLFEDENPETIVSRKMNVMKNRHAPPTEFRVNWDLTHMDFSEIVEEYAEKTEMSDL
jgi:replicative DNA helicase